MDQQMDKRLWRTAQKRAGFKRHLTAYLIINLFFWAIWWLTQGRFHGIRNLAVVWPVWPMLIWGLLIAFRYFDAYGPADKQSAVEQEYEKLKRYQQSL